MTGKVFDDSANIYQDQAKLLFDYYKKAAETIVSAEMTEEKKRAELIQDQGAAEKDKKTAMPLFIALFGGALLFLILGIVIQAGIRVLFFILAAGCIAGGVIFLLKYVNAGKRIEEIGRMITECEERYRNIRRDYSVDKVGVVYVPVATRVPFEDKSFLIDRTGGVPGTDFELTILNQPDEFQESVRKLTESMDALRGKLQRSGRSEHLRVFHFHPEHHAERLRR